MAAAATAAAEQTNRENVNSQQYSDGQAIRQTDGATIIMQLKRDETIW